MTKRGLEWARVLGSFMLRRSTDLVSASEDRFGAATKRPCGHACLTRHKAATKTANCETSTAQAIGSRGHSHGLHPPKVHLSREAAISGRMANF
uniref:Uncharacterized protein n=1 Tax=Trichuris muris TaxID=70415 RepID=A0A5S6QN68_TRIMR